MITHIVLFKLINCSDISESKKILLSMESKIPQLRHLEVGVNIIHSERSFYDLALITKFDSLEDMKKYQIHPAHIYVSNYMSSVRESTISVDFEL